MESAKHFEASSINSSDIENELNNNEGFRVRNI